MYTVKQLSDLAGVSVRTLHYYDEIGLLKPSSVGENGYRYYTEEALLLLQQILFFREMDLGLLQIKTIISDPQFDLVTALQSHRHTLQAKIDRLQTLIHTVDSTIMHVVGEINMSKQKIFSGFTPEKQKEYEQEAIKRYGEETVKQSLKRWNSYSPEQQAAIQAEGGEIYSAFVNHLDQEVSSPAVQQLVERWHQHIYHFYEPSLEVLRGLGTGYHDDPDFNAFFTAIHPDLPPFIQAAILHYVDVQETAWLEREIAGEKS